MLLLGTLRSIRCFQHFDDATESRPITQLRGLVTTLFLGGHEDAYAFTNTKLLNDSFCISRIPPFCTLTKNHHFTSMTDSIVGTLAANHSVDPNGSLSMDIPIQLPPSKMAPKISLSYHSAATSVSSAGIGWVLKGASVIERVHATKAQDDFRGTLSYLRS